MCWALEPQVLEGKSLKETRNIAMIILFLEALLVQYKGSDDFCATIFLCLNILKLWNR